MGATKNVKVVRLSDIRNLSDISKWLATWSHLDNSWDSYLSTLLACFIAVGSVLNFANSIRHAVQNYDKALPLQVLTNDVSGLALHLGSLILWAALCFGTRKKEKDFVLNSKTKHFWVHRMLARKIWGHDFLAVGFAPRLFACTMGILLFVSGNIIVTKVVPGSKLLKPPGTAGYLGWPVGMGCRADSTKPITFRKTWGSRLQIKKPTGCYNVREIGHDIAENYISRDLAGFGQADYFWVRPPNSIVKCMDKPPTYNKTCQSIAKVSPIPNLVFPYVWRNGTRVLNKNRVCTYQCAKWKPLGFQALLKNSGSLLAGAVFIIKVIDSLTTSSWLNHFPFVDTDTSIAHVKTAIERTIAPKPRWLLSSIHMKRLFALLVITAIKLCLISLTPRIDKDGYLTLDYYVTLVFTYAAIFAIILRNFNLCEFTKMVYTQDLWQKGKETFIGADTGEQLTVDLYEWFHLPACERAQFLLNYARSITIKKIPYYQPEVVDDEEGEEFGIDQETINPLQERLLQVDAMLRDLEGPCEAPPKPILLGPNKPGKKHTDDEERIVKCTKQFVGFTDVFQPDAEGAHSGTWRRCRVVVLPDKKDRSGRLIRRGAIGEILGKTHDDKLMIKWNQPPPGERDNVLLRAETKSHGTARQSELNKTEAMVKNINMAIDPKHVLQHGDAWEEIQQLVDQASIAHKEAEKGLKQA